MYVSDTNLKHIIKSPFDAPKTFFPSYIHLKSLLFDILRGWSFVWMERTFAPPNEGTPILDFVCLYIMFCLQPISMGGLKVVTNT